MFRTIKIIVMAMLCLNINTKGQEPIKPPPLKNQGVVGKVISASTSESLPGALIKIATTNFTVVSNEMGEFNLSLGNGTYDLTVHYLGHKTKSISIQIPLKAKLIVSLEPDNQNLKEVEVNAGYYTVKDRDRTGSISRVTSEAIGKQPVNNPLQALQGRVPGIEIVQNTGVPGGGFAVRIRGQNSITNGNEPLYIINGIPFPSVSISSNTINFSIIPNASPLSSINPSDIESMEILKDADATAIYGSRGANGVVLITTKKGVPGELKLDMNYYRGIGKVTRRIDLLNTDQYLTMRQEAFANDNVKPSVTDYDVNGSWDPKRYIDWQKELIGGTANTSSARVSVSGGSNQTTFLIGSTYYKEGTVFPGENSYQKISSLLNVNHLVPSNKIKLQVNIAYNLENSSLPTTDPTASIILPPNAPPPLTSDGKLNFENGTFSFSNPLAYLERNYKANTATLIANSSFNYFIVSNLELAIRIGYTKMQRKELLTNPLSAIDPAVKPTANNRTASYADNWNQTINLEPQLSWMARLGSGRLSLLTGITLQANSLHIQTLKGTGYVADGLMGNIAAASAVTVSNASNATYHYLSAYGRINYNLLDKYLFNVTGRRDGSSRFGRENIYANFGALGVAWIFGDERLFKERFSFLSFGKLRASYGTAGNDQIGDYNYLELWEPTTYSYQAGAGLAPSRLSNPIYAWEINKKAEVALELGFFQDNIRFTSAFYRNRSSNQLVNYGLAPSTGFPFILKNMPATVQNTGWEFELSWNITPSKALKWHSSFNISIPKNKLIEFPELEKSFYASSYAIGEPLTIAKTLLFTGVNPTSGLYTFFDFDGSGSITAPGDQQTIKHLGQVYTGGLQNTFAYKRWQLDFLFQFVKQTGRNYQQNIPGAPGGMFNQPTLVLQRWRGANDDTSIQKYGITSTTLPYAYGKAIGDFSISDASFIRLKNLSLAYEFSKQLLKPLGINKAKVYLQGQNLITITNYLGLDPESQKFNGLPPLCTITAGIQITF